MDKRILVCSDIHGQYDDFIQLLSTANYHKYQDQLILLGDYIDRGPKSYQVIEKVIELVERDGAIALRGNRDQWLIDFDPDDNSAWFSNGGVQTIESYFGNRLEKIREHAKWMDENLKLYHETEKYIFVHAGVRPGVPLRWQTKNDLLWIRHNRPCGLRKLVVHGHTPVNEVTRIHDQLFIDTGSVFGNKLSMVDISSGEVFEVPSKELKAASA